MTRVFFSSEFVTEYDYNIYFLTGYDYIYFEFLIVS